MNTYNSESTCALLSEGRHEQLAQQHTNKEKREKLDALKEKAGICNKVNRREIRRPEDRRVQSV